MQNPLAPVGKHLLEARSNSSNPIFLTEFAICEGYWRPCEILHSPGRLRFLDKLHKMRRMETQSATYPALYVIFTLLSAIRRGIERKNIWREFRRQKIALKPRLAFWISVCKQAGLLDEYENRLRVTRHARAWLRAHAGTIRAARPTVWALRAARPRRFCLAAPVLHARLAPPL